MVSDGSHDLVLAKLRYRLENRGYDEIRDVIQLVLVSWFYCGSEFMPFHRSSNDCRASILVKMSKGYCVL